MSLDSVLDHTATTTAPDLSAIASIGTGGPETIDAILAKLFDRARPPAAPARGGLAPWQVLRVKTHLEANLDSTVRAGDLAAIARLSPGHFSRAFKGSLGVAPTAYIAGRRVARAQTLMLTTNEPLCQIALACGFYDQSHLTRVFRRCAGSSPRDWRRRHRDGVVRLQAREGAGR
jgi:transcriptional regulator GlxA family with amidase domain